MSHKYGMHHTYLVSDKKNYYEIISTSLIRQVSIMQVLCFRWYQIVYYLLKKCGCETPNVQYFSPSLNKDHEAKSLHDCNDYDDDEEQEICKQDHVSGPHKPQQFRISRFQSSFVLLGCSMLYYSILKHKSFIIPQANAKRDNCFFTDYLLLEEEAAVQTL